VRGGGEAFQKIHPCVVVFMGIFRFIKIAPVITSVSQLFYCGDLPTYIFFIYSHSRIEYRFLLIINSKLVKVLYIVHNIKYK